MRLLFILILPITVFSYEWVPPQIVGTGRYSRFGLDCHDSLWCLFLHNSTLNGSFFVNSQWSEPLFIYAGTPATGVGGFDAVRARNGKLWALTCEESPARTVLYFDGHVWSDTFTIPGSVTGGSGFHLAADSIGKVWATFNGFEDWRIWCDVCEDTIWTGPYLVCSYPTYEQVGGACITVDPAGFRWVGAVTLSLPAAQIFLCHSDSTGAWSDSLIMGPTGYVWLADIVSDGYGNIWIAWCTGGADSSYIYTAYIDTNYNWSIYHQITQATGEFYGWCKMTVDAENKVWIVYDKGNNFYYRVWNGFQWSQEEAIVAAPASSAFHGDILYDPLRDRIWISFNIEIADMPYIFTTWTNASGATIESGEGQVVPDDFLIGCSDYLGYHWFPAVSYDSTNYLVVWQSNDDTITTYNIQGARVASDGTILDSQVIHITIGGLYHINPSIAFDGTNYLTVYDRYASGVYWNIYGSKITPDGIVLNQFPITGSTGGVQRNPAIVFDGAQYFVVWQEKRTTNYYDIYGARVTTDGNTIDTLGIPISIYADSQYTPAVSFDGTNYLVVWQDFRNGNWDIYGARVTTGGVLIDTNNIPISVFLDNQTQPMIAFDGTNYLVVWRDKRIDSNGDIYGARVTPDGIVIEPEGFPISTASGKQSAPDIIFDGTNLFVAWEDARNGYYDIYGAKVDTSGLVIDTICISSRAGEQFAPSLTKGNDKILVVYSGWTNEPYKCQRIWGVLYPLVGIQESNSTFGIFDTELLQVQPNLVSMYAYIKYSILQRSKISLCLYDNSGRLVEKIFDGERAAGTYYKELSLKNHPNGVYYLLLKAPDTIIRRKVVIVK